jgi:hypothetical protein
MAFACKDVLRSITSQKCTIIDDQNSARRWLRLEKNGYRFVVPEYKVGISFFAEIADIMAAIRIFETGNVVFA